MIFFKRFFFTVDSLLVMEYVTEILWLAYIQECIVSEQTHLLMEITC
jgi:hypothetical protein